MLQQPRHSQCLGYQAADEGETTESWHFAVQYVQRQRLGDATRLVRVWMGVQSVARSSSNAPKIPLHPPLLHTLLATYRFSSAFRVLATTGSRTHGAPFGQRHFFRGRLTDSRGMALGEVSCKQRRPQRKSSVLSYCMRVCLEAGPHENSTAQRVREQPVYRLCECSLVRFVFNKATIGLQTRCPRKRHRARDLVFHGHRSGCKRFLNKALFCAVLPLFFSAPPPPHRL